jgi:hypothetical protein
VSSRSRDQIEQTALTLLRDGNRSERWLFILRSMGGCLHAERIGRDLAAVTARMYSCASPVKSGALGACFVSLVISSARMASFANLVTRRLLINGAFFGRPELPGLNCVASLGKGTLSSPFHNRRNSRGCAQIKPHRKGNVGGRSMARAASGRR